MRTHPVVVIGIIRFGEQYSISPRVVNALHLTYNRLAINRGTLPDMPNPVAEGASMFNAPLISWTCP
jgi:hypothetical protein